MLNWFKTSPEIKFHCTVRGLEKIVPIQPARNVMPEWWKKIKVSESFKSLHGYPISQGNIKKCPAVVDMLTHGWVMPLWTDLYMNVSEESISWKASDDTFSFAVHPHDHFIHIMPEHLKSKYYWVFKPYAPWMVKTSPGYSMINLDPFYFFNPSFDTSYGIQDSDVYYDLNPLMLIKRLGEFVIPRGTPLSIIFPYKREKISCTMVPYSDATEDLLSEERLITNSMFSSAKSYNEIRKRKCPFPQL